VKLFGGRIDWDARRIFALFLQVKHMIDYFLLWRLGLFTHQVNQWDYVV
jgi:hypothetical protein